MKKLFITLTLLTLFNTQNCSNNKKKRDEILNKLANKTHPEKGILIKDFVESIHSYRNSLNYSEIFTLYKHFDKNN